MLLEPFGGSYIEVRLTRAMLWIFTLTIFYGHIANKGSYSGYGLTISKMLYLPWYIEPTI